MVFEDFPLDDYGARLPQFNAEILCVPPSVQDEPRLEDYVTGVNLIPASGEFAYATDIIEDVTGQPAPINMNNLSGQADIDHALDQLERELPNCRNISLIVSWFGTDLRVGSCGIKPGVESKDRLVAGEDWLVCGETRQTAYQVSQNGQGRPNYGGTPSDSSILQAIAAFKARGFKITIYPFILMDIPEGNGLPDPYGGSEQAAFPWRGRITASADLSAAVTQDISDFFGTCQPSDFGVSDGGVSYSGPNEYSFRRFILHYAKLAERAGGVDRFVIGSEMRGVTRLRSTQGVYPAVDKFKALAGDVRSILGSETGLTYAADWSEYFGHHDGSDVYFHLDPLWSDPNIDAVGIDAYFPLSDWREGEHLDQAVTESIYDLDYLSANMEGGEGYEWYYADASDRDTQTRTPITDGAAGKPWVFRYKDIRNWWHEPHYNRPGGIEASHPTDWVPKSKPIWFTEIGCPAIDKGSNQPNVFVDPKSSESFAPYHSNGTRDDLIQRRYIEAFLTYWRDNNEISPVYTGPMVDMGGAHIWCWDARPFPDFPARKDVWSDGLNWQLGHWLSGRTGLVPLRDVIRDIAAQSGVTDIDVSRVHGMIDGYVLDRPMSARAALEPLAGLYTVELIETAPGLKFLSHGTETRLNLTLSDIVADSPSPLTELIPDTGNRPVDLRLHFIDRAKDFQVGMVSAQDRVSESVHVIDITVPVVMGQSQAKLIAEHLLSQAQETQKSVTFGLSPARLDVETGDLITLPGLAGEWRVETIDDTAGRRVNARDAGTGVLTILSGFEPEALPPVPWVTKPELIVLDIPEVEGEGKREGVLVGVQVTPFNPVTVSGPDGEVELSQPAFVGRLTTSLSRGPVGRWDVANVCEVKMSGIVLSSVNDLDLLSGANRFTVETDQGWEIIQARDIELVGVDTYRLSRLLRGLAGTDADMMDDIPAGARIVYLNDGVVDLPISNARIGDEVTLFAEAAGRASDPATFTYIATHLRPLSPVHGKAELIDGDLHLNWIRRTRTGGDSWAGLDVPVGEESEMYRVEVHHINIVLSEYVSNENHVIISQAELTELGIYDRVTVAQGNSRFGFGTPFNL